MAPPLPPVDHVRTLPGAILFITLTGKNNGSTWSVVAYDPYINDGDSASSIVSGYQTNGFPYYEQFTKPLPSGDNSAKWQNKDKSYYGGVFGKNKGSSSITWYPWPDKSPVKDGFHLTVWNDNLTQNGVFTTSLRTLFNQDATMPVIGLQPGNPNLNFAPSTDMTIGKAVIDFYAMPLGRKIKF